MEIAGRRALPLRRGLNSVQLLAARRLEGGERGVADRVPDEDRVRRVQVDEVVVKGRSGRRARLDPDVTMCPGTLDSVVDADVVRKRRPGRVPLDVDARGHILEDGVREDALSRRGVVVDAVVAVGVGNVVVDERVVRAGIRLDA